MLACVATVALLGTAVFEERVDTDVLVRAAYIISADRQDRAVAVLGFRIAGLEKAVCGVRVAFAKSIAANIKRRTSTSCVDEAVETADVILRD